jgi:thioredoxin 1
MAAENVITITEANFEEEVVKSTIPVLVDFWAVWCGPCKAVAPILDELAGDYEGKVKIGKVNVDENQKLAAQFGISSIPTLLLFKDGKVSKQIVGMKSKKAYSEDLDQVIA